MNWIKGKKEDIVPVELIDVKRNTYAVKYAVRDYTPSEEEISKGFTPDCEYLEKIYTGNPNTMTLKLLLFESQNEYDNSDEVNCFYINGEKGWVTKADRVGLVNSITVLEAAGITEYTVWLNGKSYTLPTSVLKTFLGEVELYAMRCYEVTQQHIADIDALNSRADILNYKIHTGYPAKIEFDTNQAVNQE